MAEQRKLDTFPEENVTEIRINTANAAVYFEETKDHQIRVEAEKIGEEDYSCTLQEGCLEVVLEQKRKFFSVRHGDVPVIRLYLPRGHRFHAITLKNGAGDVHMEKEKISCDTIKAEIGAGKWTVSGMIVEKCLRAEIGAGDVTMSQMDVKRMDISCGVGNFNYQGKLSGDSKIECGMGNCKLHLDQKESDFGYDMKLGMGKIAVNNRSIKNKETRIRRENTQGTLSLECGMGKIEVETE